MVCGDLVGKEQLGFNVGFKVGKENEGEILGTKVILIGIFDGLKLGFDVMGWFEGPIEGLIVCGDFVGNVSLGLFVGFKVKKEYEGEMLGTKVILIGEFEGVRLGSLDGQNEGWVVCGDLVGKDSLGFDVGLKVGKENEGLKLGSLDGKNEG